jgi:hypothetical protein
MIRHGLANSPAEERAEKTLKFKKIVDDLSPEEQHGVVKEDLTRKNSGAITRGRKDEKRHLHYPKNHDEEGEFDVRHHPLIGMWNPEMKKYDLGMNEL